MVTPVTPVTPTCMLEESFRPLNISPSSFSNPADGPASSWRGRRGFYARVLRQGSMAEFSLRVLPHGSMSWSSHRIRNNS
ncbi:hypothetical protein EYF80_056727 [Liparis tanakae]|uniref:Uncharacterized protein n=1 Tax=Liparis tanakae TaxID=230148 RepID=A0A4Z2EXZ1_9TELE|nr:hypothetical protein EYF80_056727 [Liparis tanakae]